MKGLYLYATFCDVIVGAVDIQTNRGSMVIFIIEIPILEIRDMTEKKITINGYIIAPASLGIEHNKV